MELVLRCLQAHRVLQMLLEGRRCECGHRWGTSWPPRPHSQVTACWQDGETARGHRHAQPKRCVVITNFDIAWHILLPGSRGSAGRGQPPWLGDSAVVLKGRGTWFGFQIRALLCFILSSRARMSPSLPPAHWVAAHEGGAVPLSGASSFLPTISPELPGLSGRCPDLSCIFRSCLCSWLRVRPGRSF